MSALRQWADELAAMAVPPELLAAAAEPPHAFDVRLFARRADAGREVDTPSRARALAALPEGGEVLDVGCGAGAAALALAGRAGRLVGVDGQADMLAAFAERAEASGVAHTEVVGRWPDVAGRVAAADVVTCHHVLYNAPHLAPFVAALTTHARSRVVVELTAQHPLSWMAPLWRELHGWSRPPGPTADVAVAALGEMGLNPTVDRWDGPPTDREPGEVLAFARARLGLTASRDAELRAALDRLPPRPVRAFVTLSWDGDGAYRWDGDSAS